MSKCRSCDMPILWAITLAGKKIPLDVTPCDYGNLVLGPSDDGAPIATVTSDRTQWPRYRSHFSSCSWAEKHRKAKP